jgi:hypothetical protein
VSEERAPDNAGQEQPEQFTLTLDRLELIVLNQSINLWLADLRTRERQVDLGAEVDQTIDETFAVTRRLCEKIDNLLGMRSGHVQSPG